MTTRQMTPDEVRRVCEILEYHPHGNVTGLCNGTACIMYDGWTPRKRPEGMVYVHSYIPEPKYVTKGFLREIFRYAFENVDYVVGVTPAFNTKALAFNKRLGFAEMWRIPEGYAKGVALVYQIMHYSNCRYYQRPAQGTPL